MEKTLINKQDDRYLLLVGKCLLGCGFITLCSYVRIPFYPVPFTLQLFAITLLALLQSPKIAVASTLSYLLCASCGLPVFGSGSNILWMIGKCGGYLVAFPIAAYVIAKLSQAKGYLVAIACSYCIIYVLGMLWLATFIGIKFAFLKGVLFFIPADLLKALAAVGIASLWKRGKDL